MLTSISTGSGCPDPVASGSGPVGKPIASGFGVMREAMPPCGATPAPAGSEVRSRPTSPASVIDLR